MTDSAEITRQAKSNLAFALQILPKERREGMVTFYAFCRVVDDLADDPARPLAERRPAGVHACDGRTLGLYVRDRTSPWMALGLPYSCYG